MKNLTPAWLLLTLTLTACGAQTTGKPASQSAKTPPAVGNRAGTAYDYLPPPRPTPFRGEPMNPALLRAPLPDTPLASPAAALSPQAATKLVRVFYSVPLPASSPYRDGGAAHATILSNLLGQYTNVQVISKPISQYVSGDAKNSLRTFYIGTVYDEPIPANFLSEVKAGAPVTWMGYNFWELGDTSSLGITYKQLRTALSAAEIAAAYSTVTYKGYDYHKYPAPQEINEIAADPAKTQTLAVAKNAAGNQLPYLLRSNNFYFVADNPFSYIYPTDRYVAVADSLKTMLGDTQTATCKNQAILRLEDVSAMDDPKAMSDLLNVIAQLKIPFAMNIIPESYYDGKHYSWLNNGQQLLQIYRATSLGGLVMQHGYTHNYHGLKVPEGNSGDEWEFWDKQNNQPLSALTPAAAKARIQKGRSLLLSLGLKPQMWTTPHYEADTSLYPAINSLYPKVIERRMYSADGQRFGQFFPYPVKDAYGSLIVPENLGNIQLDPDYFASDIVATADANKNLSCAFASFFIHPYLFSADYTDRDRLTKDSFKKMLTDIQAKGFTFVNPNTVTTRTLQ